MTKKETMWMAWGNSAGFLPWVYSGNEKDCRDAIDSRCQNPAEFVPVKVVISEIRARKARKRRPHKAGYH